MEIEIKHIFMFFIGLIALYIVFRVASLAVFISWKHMVTDAVSRIVEEKIVEYIEKDNRRRKKAAKEYITRTKNRKEDYCDGKER